MLKVRSKGAIKTILGVTCNFDGQIGGLYCRMQNWYSEGWLLSMMVSVRFQLILFLLCAAYEKRKVTLNRNIQSYFQQLRTVKK